ncbi:MAG: thiolase [Dehalococcoidia bacterium]
MPNNPTMAAALVGAGESDKIGYVPEKTSLMLHAEAIKNAAADAGIQIRDIEAVFSAGGVPGMQSPGLAEYLGIKPKWFDSTTVGGSAFVMYVHHALAAINAGIFDIAVISHGESGYSGGRRMGKGTGGTRGQLDPWAPSSQFEGPFGLAGAPSSYSHAMNRYMHQFGVSKEQFAQIAVVTREWAGLNPKAVMHSKETNPNGGPITIEDVLNSRVISWPLNLLDVCLVTDHGGAVIVASAAAAKSLRRKPVWVAGAGEAMSHSSMLAMDDFTRTSASVSSARAYKMAGLGPNDMEMAMIYDSFTYTAGVTAEMLGLTKRGEGPTLWAGDNARPGGKFPVNTNGGGLSFSHSGMYGMMLLVEAQRQLAGTAEEPGVGLPGRQTKAKTAVVNGTGGSLSTTGTIVLKADS